MATALAFALAGCKVTAAMRNPAATTELVKTAFMNFYQLYKANVAGFLRRKL